MAILILLAICFKDKLLLWLENKKTIIFNKLAVIILIGVPLFIIPTHR